jgi:hypothetical protein
MTAGATYVPIFTQTLGSAAPSVTIGTGGTIPQGYTDLMLEINYGLDNVNNNVNIRVGNYAANSGVDTGSNYSETFLAGNGSTVSSGRNSNFSYSRLTVATNGGDATNIGATITAHLMSYSNTTTNKTILSRAGSTTGTYAGTEAEVNLWRSNNAINIINVYASAGNFLAGTTFTLYGIAAA